MILKNLLTKTKPYKSGNGVSMNKTKVDSKITGGSPFKLNNGLGKPGSAKLSPDDIKGGKGLGLSGTGMF